MTRVVLRAHLLKSVGPGQRYLMECEWHEDGRVMQRVNAGEPVKENEWQEIGRWHDLDAERARSAREGWQLD